MPRAELVSFNIFLTPISLLITWDELEFKLIHWFSFYIKTLFSEDIKRTLEGRIQDNCQTPSTNVRNCQTSNTKMDLSSCVGNVVYHNIVYNKFGNAVKRTYFTKAKRFSPSIFFCLRLLCYIYSSSSIIYTNCSIRIYSNTFDSI